ncbi:hypothetical protein KA082_00555 [Candidatus Woesebacteria bacterium]|nr:hypothetical protein [Candidatus Woesebacteria bacterium]
MSQMQSVRPRPSGGFQQGLGQFNEHLDEQAMQQAAKQQALTQQSATPATTPTAAQALAGAAGMPTDLSELAAGGAGAEGGTQAAQSPSFFDAVIAQPVQDLAKTILEALHLDTLLGLMGSSDTPQDKAKKQAMMRRYNELTQEEQAVARATFQRRQQEEKRRLEEEQARKHRAEQARAQSIAVPASPQRGSEGAGQSRKSQAVSKLEQDRKTLSGPQSAG